jgi:hypothetical protein
MTSRAIGYERLRIYSHQDVRSTALNKLNPDYIDQYRVTQHQVVLFYEDAAEGFACTFTDRGADVEKVATKARR